MATASKNLPTTGGTDKSGQGDKGEAKTPPRSVEEIQRDLDRTRQRLVSNIATLKEETQPKALANKAGDKVQSVFRNPDGSVRTERVAAVAGVVVGLFLLSRGVKSHKKKKELQALAQVVWVPVPRRAVSAELIGVSRNAKELAPLVDEYQPALTVAGG